MSYRGKCGTGWSCYHAGEDLRCEGTAAGESVFPAADPGKDSGTGIKKRWIRNISCRSEHSVGRSSQQSGKTAERLRCEAGRTDTAAKWPWRCESGWSAAVWSDETPYPLYVRKLSQQLYEPAVRIRKYFWFLKPGWEHFPDVKVWQRHAGYIQRNKRSHPDQRGTGGTGKRRDCDSSAGERGQAGSSRRTGGGNLPADPWISGGYSESADSREWSLDQDQQSGRCDQRPSSSGKRGRSSSQISSTAGGTGSSWESSTGSGSKRSSREKSGRRCSSTKGSTAESSAAGSVSDTEKIKQQYNNDYNDK